MVRSLAGAIERFLAVETASGIVLIVAAALALAWANSPWHGHYERLWHATLPLRLGSYDFSRSLHFWINDGWMTAFFFVAGLEIRREMHRGELSDLSRAALPVVAALGGMIVPALVYLSLNRGGAGARGWGTPMATDIAFAIGVLTLLGRRVSPAVRVLVLALAVIDDVGAIVVIAVFYSSGLSASGLAIAAGGIAGVLLLRVVRVRSPAAYVLPGGVFWWGLHRAGIEPTLAGVVLGMMTPVRAADGRGELAPAERLEHLLHRWVAFVVMPLFAFANAGVRVGHASLRGASLGVALGVTLGLVVGKPVGVVVFSLVARRWGIVRFPAGIHLRHVVVVGLVAGVGFTMALYIAQLGLPSGTLRDTAKLAIVTGSVLAALLTWIVGRTLHRAEPGEVIAESESEAETRSEA